MAKISIDIKETTKEKLRLLVIKSGKTLKKFVLDKIGIKDE